MTLYFWWDGVTGSGDWDSTDPWYSDAGHTTPAGVTPITGDSVYLTGSNAPSAGPGSPVALALFDSTALAAPLDYPVMMVTNQITIQSGGSFAVGGPGTTLATTNYQLWFGAAADNTVTGDVYGAGSNSATLDLDTIDWHDDGNWNAGAITARRGTFNDASSIAFFAAVFNGDLAFKDSSVCNADGLIVNGDLYVESDAGVDDVTVNGNAFAKKALTNSTVSKNVVVRTGGSQSGNTIGLDVITEGSTGGGGYVIGG